MNALSGGRPGRGPGARFQHLLVWLILLALWQLWVWAGHIPELVAPSPVEVMRELAAPGWLAGPLASTVGTALLGGGIGMVMGAGLALACWLVPLSRFLVLPPALALCAVPLVVFAPLIGLAVGYGNLTVIVMTVVIALFPTFVFLDAGLRSVAPSAADLMRVFGASRVSVLRHLSLPSSVPSLGLALRITAGSVILAAFTADYLVGSTGLGHLVAYQEYYLQTARIWASCITVIIVSVILFLGASALSDRLTAWHQAG